ncbi:MAG: hypothetical protein M3R70_02925 [Actinomycetota bacterium]|nr:hypothetical protein [Actinomycetota bacterium]
MPATAQVSRRNGIYIDVGDIGIGAGDPHTNGESRLGEDVRCLACGFVYRKPLDAGVAANPNCPNCGYAGWLSTAIPLDPAERGRHQRPHEFPEQ